jgi:hypothetical protein
MKSVLPELVRLSVLTKSRRSGSFGEGSNMDEMELMFSAYVEGLSDLVHEDVVEACRRWPALPDRGRWWPALEELRGVADDVACERRVRSLPPPVQEQASRTPALKPMSDADEASIRRNLAWMRSAPHEFPGFASLVAIGEEMLRRAGR